MALSRAWLLVLCLLLASLLLPAVRALEDVEEVPADDEVEADEGQELKHVFSCDRIDGLSDALHVTRLNDDVCDCKDGKDEPDTGACERYFRRLRKEAGEGEAEVVTDEEPTGPFQCEKPDPRLPEEGLERKKVKDGECDCCDGSDELPGWCPDLCGVRKPSKQEQQERIERGKKLRRKQMPKADELWEKDEYRIFERKAADNRQQLRQLESQTSRIERREDQERRARNARDWKNYREELAGLALSADDVKEVIAQITLMQDEKTAANVSEIVAEVDPMIDTIEIMLVAMPLHQQRKEPGGLKTNEERLAKVREILGLKDMLEESAREILEKFVKDSFLGVLIGRAVSKVTGKSMKALHPAAIPHWELPEARLHRKAVQKARDEDMKTDMRHMHGQGPKRVDYGPDHIFLVLKEKCWDLEQTGNNYRVCFFGAASKNKENIGNFMGDYEDKHTVMKFENGESTEECEEGSKSFVTFECGDRSKLLWVKRNKQCEFFFQAESPLVCPDD